MYEQFSEHARNVMAFANAEARRLNHEYIGTEHVLLGLIQENRGVAARALKSLGLELTNVRSEVERLIQSGPDRAAKGKLPHTPRVKKAIEHAMEESRNLGHSYIGTEHLLLGLLRDGENVAAQVLVNLGLNFNPIRKEVIKLLASGEVVSEPFGKSKFERLIRRLFTKDQESARFPRIPDQLAGTASLVAVDIGNSGIKLGRFIIDRRSGSSAEQRMPSVEPPSLPQPVATLDLPIVHETGLFDLRQFVPWCEKHLSPEIHWSIASVHRGAGEFFATTIAAWAKQLQLDWPIRRLTCRDVPLKIHVDQPERVGVDRLLAAVAANEIRAPERAAIVVDLGTAITVDLVERDGRFAGGAILPGFAMSARALAEQTDALPLVTTQELDAAPEVPGKSTIAAIQAGLYWGAVGAIRELAFRLAADCGDAPDVFVTGGASQNVAERLTAGSMWTVRHVPHLVLAGIALLGARAPGRAGG